MGGNLWGTLFRSMLSLYEAILSGVDWDTLARPLWDIHPLWVIAFMLYIAFALLCMMNVITSIFVQAAHDDAERLKDHSFEKQALRALYACREDKISRESFEIVVDNTDFHRQMKTIGIAPHEVRCLF